MDRTLLITLLPGLAATTLTLMALWRAGARALPAPDRSAHPDLDLCTRGVWAIGVLAGSGIALGAFGALSGALWAIAASAVALLVAALWRDDPRAAEEPSSPPLSPVFVLILCGYAFGRAIYLLRNPPADWDSLQYHLPMVAHWFVTHSLGVAPHVPPAFGTYYAGCGELLQLGAAFAAGRDTLMGWPALALALLFGLASRRLALLAGAAPRVAEGTALVVVLAPEMVQLTLGVRIDVMLAALFTLALLFAERYRRGRAPADLATAILAVGLAAGAKTNALVLAPLALVLLWPLTPARAPLAPTAGGVRRWTPVALALVLGGLSALWWPIRSMVATHNPFFPAPMRLGHTTLPGLMDATTLWRTTQIAVWREGYAGHLTFRLLMQFFGAAFPLLVLGAALAPLRPASGESTSLLRRLALFAAIAFALFLVTPFSGAYWPSVGSTPPRLNRDNLRYMLPTVVALAPIAAAGLSRFAAPWVGIALFVVALAGLGNKLTHVIPGIVLAALLLGIGRWLMRRTPPRIMTAAGAVAAVLAVSAAATLVEPMRARGNAREWDHYLTVIHNLPAHTLDSLRTAAHGRAIAVVGTDAWWGYYGRTFSGHPLYLPVAGTWSPDLAPWHYHLDDRTHPDRERWLENVRASGAAFVISGAFDGNCATTPVELGWMRADTARFQPVATRNCDVVFRVRSLAPQP